MIAHMNTVIIALGVISILLMIFRARVRRRTFGRFAMTFFTSIFWIAFLAVLGYKIGYSAGAQGISLLKVLHIKK